MLVGFDQTLTYARLCRAAWWITQGKPYFATNPDRVCPTDQPTVLVDCGSITAALQTATGCAPKAVLGKPDPAMLEGILRGHHLAAEKLAMVGDRLYTDMAMARRAGAVGRARVDRRDHGGRKPGASNTASPICFAFAGRVWRPVARRATERLVR